MKLFVYGSLKSDKRANGFLEGCRKISLGVSSIKYEMIGYRFPTIRRSEEGHPIEGEIYEVTPEVVRSLDRYESHPSFYERVVVPILGYDGDTHDCYVYEGRESCVMFQNSDPIKPENGVLKW